MKLDIAGNRQESSYGLGEKARRIAWAMAQPAFRFSPRIFFFWRRFLLRAFGSRIGARVHIYPSVAVFAPWLLEVGEDSSVGDGARLYNLGVLTIGRRATVSQGAHLCGGTHDYTRTLLPLKRCPVVVGDDAWVCADAFIGPGVSVGQGAVVGARAVAMKDVPPWTVVAGNPARIVKKRLLLQDDGGARVADS